MYGRYYLVPPDYCNSVARVGLVGCALAFLGRIELGLGLAFVSGCMSM